MKGEAMAAGSNQSGAERFEEFVRLVSSLEKEVQRIRAAECERLGLRGADLMCLYYLGKSAGGMTAAELSRAAGVTRAAVSRTLATLSEQGLVEVDEAAGDTRRYRAGVRLTERGRVAMSGVEAAVSRVMSTVDSALEEGERSELYASMASVLECLKGIDR